MLRYVLCLYHGVVSSIQCLSGLEASEVEHWKAFPSCGEPLTPFAIVHHHKKNADGLSLVGWSDGAARCQAGAGP